MSVEELQGLVKTHSPSRAVPVIVIGANHIVWLTSLTLEERAVECSLYNRRPAT